MPVSGYDLYLASLYIDGQVLSEPGPVRDGDGGATAAAVLGIFGRRPFEALQGVTLR
jgi:hypothetical protein